MGANLTRRTGSADLPLHGGHVPSWLATRMAALGRVMPEAIVHHYGRDELLRRLAHPFWFQSFGAVDILIGNQSAVRLHTNVLIYNIVNTLQVENNPGAAAIMATVLFLITLSLTVLQMRFLERRVHYA